MEDFKTCVINLYGVPGSGKTTASSYIFSELKKDSYFHIEEIHEFNKELMYEFNQSGIENIAYQFGVQSYRMSRLINKYNWLITDAPLLMSVLYAKNDWFGEELFDSIAKFEKKVFKTYNYFIDRKDQKHKERFIQMEHKLKDVLKNYQIEYQIIDGSKESLDEIISFLKSEDEILRSHYGPETT